MYHQIKYVQKGSTHSLCECQQLILFDIQPQLLQIQFCISLCAQVSITSKIMH